MITDSSCFLRFVQTPSADVTKRLAAENDELKSESDALGKKLHYLETTYKNSRDNFEQILRNAGGSA